MHPEYEKDRNKFWYDVALIKIDCEQNSEKLAKARPFEFRGNEKLLSDEYLVAGYGRTSDTYSGSFPSTSLTFVANGKIKYLEIAKDYGAKYQLEMFNLNVAGMILCSKASSNRTAFFGDSGGPMFNFTESKKPILLGIFSIMQPDDASNLLGTMNRNCFGSAKLSQNWIEKILN